VGRELRAGGKEPENAKKLESTGGEGQPGTTANYVTEKWDSGLKLTQSRQGAKVLVTDRTDL
jgi:hypothetical protein